MRSGAGPLLSAVYTNKRCLLARVLLNYTSQCSLLLLQAQLVEWHFDTDVCVCIQGCRMGGERLRVMDSMDRGTQRATRLKGGQKQVQRGLEFH